MKSIRLEVEMEPVAKPKRGTDRAGWLPGLKTRIFGFTEGGRYWYRVTVVNVGDEPIGSGPITAADGKIIPGDLSALRFRWICQGVTSMKGQPFPVRLNPGNSHTFERVHHDVLSAGFTLLYVDVIELAHAANLEVQDSRKQVVPFESEPRIAVGEGTNHRNASSVFAFETFRAISGSEVNQYILITVAVTALIVNAIFGVLHYVK